MGSNLFVLVALRATALSLSFIPGRARAAEYLYLLADVVEAGRATDAHMQAVADLLKSRTLTDADWDDVEARIQLHSAALQA